jgi:hypothetical protein
MFSNSYAYIIQNFTTKKQIDDYVALIKALHKQGQLNPSLRSYAYDVFIGEGGFDFENIPIDVVPNTNWWTTHTPPKLMKLIEPENDKLWETVRVKAVKAAIINKSPKPNVSDAQVLGYLRRFFDKFIPANVALNNPTVSKAWKKFYDENKLGGAGGPGNGITLFGNWFALGVFIDYATVRLQSYDVTKKEFPPEGTGAGTGPGTGAGGGAGSGGGTGGGAGTGTGGGRGTGTGTGGGTGTGTGGGGTETERDIDEDYALRYSVLEEFLTHAIGTYNPAGPTSTASVFNTYAARNGVQLWDPSLNERDEFVIFQKIFAPAKDSKVLENSIKFQKTLFAKIESTGLLDLLVQSDQIRQFGRDRFANEESAKASAGKVVRRR